MAAPKKSKVKAKKGDKRLGNQFWTLRSKHGRDMLFATPELMWEAACEYFQWCIENPIQDTRSFGQRKVQRPFTMQGLCAYLDCNTAYFRIFKSQLPPDEKDFNTVISRIEDTVYQQKFELAAIGVFKDNIIARDLGLRDKTDTELTGKDGGPIQHDHKFKITLNLNK